ncbi:winged helix-turn-helix domain-containing protein [Enterococcus sp. DIV0800]|uniref:winged helix-turn-helix domain-containing protein n=1 Tax=unclassified Enterococcus TaxID=2608891 RepID=UPI003D2FBFAB
MNQILILTRNVLSEKTIQQKLQNLDYEVYCSSSLFRLFNKVESIPEIFMYFQFVILSETITEIEVAQLIPLLRQFPINIIRKFDEKLSDTELMYIEENQINGSISTEFSIDELRECFHQFKEPFKMNDSSLEDYGKLQTMEENMLGELYTPIDIDNMVKEQRQLMDTIERLTPTEAKILRILINSEGNTVSREEMCQKIWNGEVNNSHKVSLSSAVTRMKDKFRQNNIGNNAIHTIWGKGYRINFDLFEKIKKDKKLSSLLLIA